MEVLREEMIRQRPNIIKDMDCFPLCWEVSRVIEKAKFGKPKESCWCLFGQEGAEAQEDITLGLVCTRRN